MRMGGGKICVQRRARGVNLPIHEKNVRVHEINSCARVCAYIFMIFDLMRKKCFIFFMEEGGQI